MKEEKKLVPKRRFKGFEEEWWEKKLENIAETYSGGTPSVTNKAFYNGPIPFIRSGEINLSLTSLSITVEGLQKSSARLVEKGDILYALYGATSGEVSISKIQGAINQAILAIKPQQNYDKYYLLYWFKKHKVNIINSQLQGGQGNLSGEIIRNLLIDLPNKEEQQKIGQFFKVLDKRIANQKRKIAKVKALKSAYLTEMFPQEGETVPKRRFKEFEGEWVKVRLSDIACITMGHSPSSANYTNNPSDYVLVQGNADIKKNRVHPRVWTTEVTKIAKKNELIFTVRAPVGEVAKTEYDVVLGRGVAAIDGNDFIFQYLIKINEEGYWKNLSSGSTFDSISSDDISNLSLSIPSEKEQQKIGQFFKNLDDQIAIEERKLAKLKAMKEAYLEEIFV